jgi:hypothetical protein
MQASCGDAGAIPWKRRKQKKMRPHASCIGKKSVTETSEGKNASAGTGASLDKRHF